MPPGLSAPLTAAVRDEFIALVVKYGLIFYYYAVTFQTPESRLHQVTGGLTDANRMLLAHMAAELVERCSTIFQALEWPLPLRHAVDLYRRLDPTGVPDDTPGGPPLATLDAPPS